ncbi:MAG: hypothetical protein ACRDDY_04140 [Clostridium sp.]|uniref:hypothetical protein n=1 Tax=Clostridium sp. TaxID=1506 RepID=UPI003EE6B6DC
MSEIVKLKGLEVLTKTNKMVQVYGTITNIEADVNKVSKKEGKNGVPTWVGTITTITLKVNGTTQKIRVMGCTLDGDKKETEYIWNKVKAFAIDGNGDILKGDDGKAIFSEIFPAKYNPATQKIMDRKTVREFTGNVLPDGKKECLYHLDEITTGRYATKLYENKSMLIGKQVIINGNMKFEPNQDATKVDLNIDLNSITIRNANEKREFKEGFRVVAPIILHTSAVLDGMGEVVKAQNAGKEIDELKIQALAPVYHKYLTPMKRDGKEIKGRTVYVPMQLDITNKNFLGMGKIEGFDFFKKLDLFKKVILGETQGAEGYIAINTDMSYKSGVIQRDIDMEDLKDDPIFVEEYISYVNATTQEEKDRIKADTMSAYKAINPTSVRGEFKQSLEFVSYVANKDSGNQYAVIGEDAFEIYSLDKIKKEVEIIKGGATQPTPTPVAQPKVEAVNISSIPEPSMASTGISDDDMADEFPF